jgi:transposase-like protein
MIGAVGVDQKGRKHLLSVEPGAAENAASVKRLFTRLRDNGLKAEQKDLFVIDDSKTLRAAWKSPTAEEGEKRIEHLARFLERDHEQGAQCLREVVKDTFTRLDYCRAAISFLRRAAV